MRKILCLISCIMLALGVMTAQGSSDAEYGPSTISEAWFVDANVGAQVLFTEDASLRPAAQRFTPYISIGAGKWWTPFLASSLHLSGYQLNGASSNKGIYIANPNGTPTLFGNNDPVREFATILPNGSYYHNLFYINAHFDLATSIFNIIHRGYLPDFPWDIVPSIGLGYMHVFQHKGIPAADAMSVHAAILASYKIQEHWSVFAQVQSTVFPDAIDGRLMGKMHESALHFAVGATYHIGKHHFKSFYQPAQAEIIERLITDTIILEKHVVDTIVVEQPTNEEVLPAAYILFPVGQTTPQDDIDFQLATVSNYVAAHPKARIIIEGYADKQTGSEKRNKQLAQLRCDYVASQLQTRCHVDPANIQCIAHGAQSKPIYSTAHFNRLVTITLLPENSK